MKAHTFENTAAQGDCFIKRVDRKAFPSNAEQEPVEGGNYIVAHSETGHHHVIPDRHCRLLKGDEFTSWLEVDEGKSVILKHLRDHDTHAPIEIGSGTYKITRQREYTPEGYRRAQD